MGAGDPIAMTQRLFALLSASASAVALFTAAPLAVAQTATEARQLEAVVVTARKREEESQDVPVSITSLGGEKLAVIASGGSDISFLSARVPSVISESSFGRTFPRFYIRGLGNTDFDLNASQPVSFIYDDVVYENPVLKGFPVFDIQAIEVLRGPQGTLFGRNTPAGIIKFDSVKPGREFSGYAKAGVRSYSGLDLEAAAGGPVNDFLSVRVSALVQSQDDWVDNARSNQSDFAGGYTETAGRIQLRFQPNEAFDANINIHARDFDGTGQLFRANIIRRGTNDIVAGFDREKVFYDGGAGNNQSLETFGVTARADYDFTNGMTLTYVGGYESLEFFSRGDVDGGFGAVFLPFGGPGVIPFPAESADGIPDHEQITHELRLSGGDAASLSWQVGLYSFSEDVTIDSFSLDTLGGGVINARARQNQKTDSVAVFGSVSWQASDALNLTAGLRYTDDERDFVARRTLGAFGAPPLGPIRRNLSDSALSWDLSAVYTLTPDVNVYGRVARGYRAPSIQGRIAFSDAVTTANSEFVTSIEAGVKAFAFDRRLRADVGVFRYVIEDQQLTAIGGAGNFNQLINADEGIGQGFELDLEWLPLDNLAITGGLSYNQTEINDPTLRVAPCGAPCTVLDPVVGGLARIDGNSFPNAPEWIANVTARYSMPFGDRGELFAFTDWAYKGETNFFLYESREFSEDGYWEGGLRLGYARLDGSYEVAVYGRNITDETRLIGGIDFNNLTGFINNPRTWGAEIKIKR
jgi:iron complex outermembrane receptor protein